MPCVCVRITLSIKTWQASVSSDTSVCMVDMLQEGPPICCYTVCTSQSTHRPPTYAPQPWPHNGTKTFPKCSRYHYNPNSPPLFAVTVQLEASIPQWVATGITIDKRLMVYPYQPPSPLLQTKPFGRYGSPSQPNRRDPMHCLGQ
jgi:hypothetical protein